MEQSNVERSPEQMKGIRNGKIYFLTKKLDKYLEPIVVCSFMLLTILMFILLASAVAVNPATSESLGNAYSTAKFADLSTVYVDFLSTAIADFADREIVLSLPTVRGSAIALVVFTVFALFFAAAIIYIYFKNARASIVVYGIAGGFSFVFFILSAILIGAVNNANASLAAQLDGIIPKELLPEFVSLGAGPILVLVFSLLFFLFFVGAFVVKFLKSRYVTKEIIR